jgi:lipoate-protein ligase A
MTSPAWHVEHVTGDAASFHARLPEVSPAASRLAWVFDVAEPALALGSAQRAEAVDGRVAGALGVAVVQRRSGGGAVLMIPGEVVWVDFVLGAGDPLWDDDVARAMHWVGRAWSAALGSLGVVSSVHTGPLVRTPWSSAVCFAGVGSGEVTDHAGRKLVGVAQRRTRGWARFQTMCHLRWRPELVAALAAAPRPAPADLAPLVATVDATPADLTTALLAALP